MAAAPYLEPFRPVAKFLLIKGLIFVLYWQSIVIAIVSALGGIKPIPGRTKAETTVLLNNWLVCLEVLPFSLLAWQGFRPSKVRANERMR